MFDIVICVMIYISSEMCLCQDSVIDNTELVLAYMIHRHGDRTPLERTIKFATDKEKVIKRTLKYGYGQLTDKGKMRSYELGKFIRHRYNTYLSEKYNSSEIYIRSTDSTRTKMTVLSAMAAVYPAGQDNWSEDINWTPVPYTTMPVIYDRMLATVNCPVLVKWYEDKIVQPIPSMEKYKPLLNKISETISINITAMPALLADVHNVFLSQISLGVPVPPSLEPFLNEIEEGAGEVLNVIFGDERNFAMQSGVPLKNFFDVADKIKSGQNVPRIQVFSAHDSTVFTFSAASRIIPHLGFPKYASLFALELRRDVTNGNYIVVPVYLEQPDTNEKYLTIDGCKGFCDLESFRLMTSKYLINETEWRVLCGWSEDHDFETSFID